METAAGGGQVVMQAGQVMVRQVSAAQLVGRPFLAVLAGSVSEARRAEAELAMVNPGGSFKAKAPLDLGRLAFACLLGSLLVVWQNRRTEKYGGRPPEFFRTLVLLYGPWFSKLEFPSTHGDPRTPASLSPSGGACGTAWAVHTAICIIFIMPYH